jgi:hypothetical protein
MKVNLNSRHNSHHADGEYNGKKIIVYAGSKINQTDAYAKMPPKIKEQRHDPNLVSQDGILLKNISFESPTGAAVFVTGRSTNGKVAWRVNNSMSIKEYLKSKD